MEVPELGVAPDNAEQLAAADAAMREGMEFQCRQAAVAKEIAEEHGLNGDDIAREFMHHQLAYGRDMAKIQMMQAQARMQPVAPMDLSKLRGETR